jgi:hypothetical protein
MYAGQGAELQGGAGDILRQYFANQNRQPTT